MMARISLILTLWLSFPALGHAAILINEIAWMGTSDSANYEWIELHNTSGEAVDVTGWELRDGGSLTIALMGSIAGGAHVLLERNRSSEAYLTDVPFVVYTGALVNSGATLTLYRSNGSVEDQVSGGEGWQSIGGDNATKDTAQYTGSGWVTAAPTPAAANSQVSSNTGSNQSSNTTSNRSVSSGRTVLSGSTAERDVPKLSATPGVLQVAITGPEVAYVGQPLTLKAIPSGLGRTLHNSLSYEWNFGDSYTGVGVDPNHVYQYPGTYVVTVSASYRSYTAVGRYEVTVLPIVVSLSTNAAGELQLHNDAQYEVDVSGYRLVGDSTLVMPAHSIMLPKSTIVVPHEQLEPSPQALFALYSRDRSLVTTTMPDPPVVQVPSRVVVANAPPRTQPVVSRALPSPTPLASTTASDTVATAASEAATTSTFFTPLLPAAVAAEMAAAGSVADKAEALPATWWTYGGLILLLVLSSGFMWWQRRHSQSVIDV